MKRMIPLILLLLLTNMHLSLSAKLSFKNPDEMLAYVQRFLPENPVILEAGGRFGEDTLRMKSVWPLAIMHVFEPLPSSFNTLVEALQYIADVHCYPYALTSHSGVTDFYINEDNCGASSINAPVSWNEGEFEKAPIQVPCITLNEWAQRNQISHIDFMWLDMEGHELYALEHGTDILKTVKAIYTEVSFEPIRLNSGLYINLRKLLAKHGFLEVWRSTYQQEKYGDALFVKKGSIPIKRITQ